MKFSAAWLAVPAVGTALVAAAVWGPRAAGLSGAAGGVLQRLQESRSLDAPSAPGAALEASGTIEGTVVRVSAKLQGRVVSVAAKEGETVTRGQPLVALEGDEVRAQVDQARARLRTAEARYQEARAGTEAERLRQAEAEVQRAQAARAGAAAAVRNLQAQLDRGTELKQGVDAAESQVASSEAALQAAQARLERVRAGARPDEVREAEQAVAAAQATAERATAEEDRLHRAFDRGAVARRDWDLARTEKEVAGANLARARARLADLRAGARPEELREAEQGVAAARAGLDGARAALANARQLREDRLPAQGRLDAARAELKEAEEAVRVARASLDLLRAGARPEQLRQLAAQVDEARAALALAETRRGDLVVPAPLSGTVVARQVEPGEVVLPGARLLEIADPRSLWVRVYLREADYGRVRVGDRVEMTTDSLPGKRYGGRVRTVAREAEFTPRNVQTRDERVNLMYGIRVDVANTDGRLVIGMPVDVRFR